METAVLHEKLKQETNGGWQISESAIQRFGESLPNIVALVNEKFRLEAPFAENINLNFLMDAHQNFGEMLLSVYQFHLWDDLIDEVVWYVQTIGSRGLNERYLTQMLKTWMIAMHSYIKPPEINELIQPIAWISRYVQTIFQIKEEELPGKASELLELLFRNEKDKAEELVNSFLNSDEAIINKLFVPALSEIGKLWSENRISVADEHLAVANLRAIYQLFLKSRPSEKKEQKITVCCVPGEEHEIGAELLSLYLERRGWNMIFIGHSTPEAEILRILDRDTPYAIILSITLISHLPALKSLVQRLRSCFPSMKILAGGRIPKQAKEVIHELVDAVPDSFDECCKTLESMVKYA